ncbi:MAG: hypothetical protein WC307_01245 [Candidatus Nanoarchaeia archaeon]|jgi:hypothetical protein
MNTLKAVLIHDYAGNNLFSHFGNGVKTDPALFSGMLCALDSFNREMLGDNIKSMTCKNGLKLLSDEFYLTKRVTRYHFNIDSSINLDEPLVVKDKNNDYVVASTIPDFNGVSHSLSELLPKFGAEPKLISVFNYCSDKPFGFVHYNPEYVFEPTIVKQPKMGVYYCVIYDSRDDSLGDYFVESKFEEIGFLLKKQSQLIGPAVSWGGTSILANLKPIINDFFKQYLIDRSMLAGSKLFDNVKIPELGINEQTISEMKKKASELKQLFND